MDYTKISPPISYEEFVGDVLHIETIEDAQAFFEAHVRYLRDTLGVVNAERKLATDIGWCFGEGMAIPRREMWNEVCGAIHPAGPDFTHREFTPTEMFQAGKDLAEKYKRPTAWRRILND